MAPTERICETQLKWLGYVRKRPESTVRRIDGMEQVFSIRGRGRQIKTWMKMIGKLLRGCWDFYVLEGPFQPGIIFSSGS